MIPLSVPVVSVSLRAYNKNTSSGPAARYMIDVRGHKSLEQILHSVEPNTTL